MKIKRGLPTNGSRRTYPRRIKRTRARARERHWQCARARAPRDRPARFIKSYIKLIRIATPPGNLIHTSTAVRNTPPRDENEMIGTVGVAQSRDSHSVLPRGSDEKGEISHESVGIHIMCPTDATDAFTPLRDA